MDKKVEAIIVATDPNAIGSSAGYDALDEAFRSLTEKRADFGSKMKRVESSIESWTQIREDLIAEHQNLYGNNTAAMAELISNMHALMDSEKQRNRFGPWRCVSHMDQ
jgi:flagellin-like hook-associated protein FlgL